MSKKFNELTKVAQKRAIADCRDYLADVDPKLRFMPDQLIIQKFVVDDVQFDDLGSPLL